MQTANFDNNATTPIDPRVLELIERTQRSVCGNPSSLHSLGRAARRVVEEARDRVAAACGCLPREVYFVSSATEANNLAVFGRQLKRGQRVLVNPMEHKSVLAPLEASAADLLMMDVLTTGIVDASKAVEQIDSNVDWVVCQAANNETGCLQPIAALSEACEAMGVPLFVDAVQIPGRAATSDLVSCGAGASLSSHKVFGPKGVGALLVRAETSLSPMLLGGAQERGRRAGTESVATIAGFGLAMELAVGEATERQAVLSSLGAQLQACLSRHFPEGRVNGAESARLPGVINFCVPRSSAESFMMNLDMVGIAASVGSACSSGSTEPSHVLDAMGLSLADNHASIRFSLSHGNDSTEIEHLDVVLGEMAPRLFL